LPDAAVEQITAALAAGPAPAVTRHERDAQH